MLANKEILKIIKGSFLVCFFILWFSNFCFAQEVEHNFTVGPQSTTCDSLKMHGLSMDQCIKQIRSSKFRFDQKFRLTRKQGLQQGEFYACDGKTGFLIIKFDEEVLLYEDVDKTYWTALIGSSDPEGYYLKSRVQLQSHD